MHRALVGRHGRSIRLGVSGELCKASLHQELIFFTVSFCCCSALCDATRSTEQTSEHIRDALPLCTVLS